jgi:hypothetical protein
MMVEDEAVAPWIAAHAHWLVWVVPAAGSAARHRRRPGVAAPGESARLTRYATLARFPPEPTRLHRMPESVPLDVASLSHPGMVRSHNEDTVFVDGEAGIAVLADGMGGYNAGEVASGIAVNVVSNGMMPELRSGRELSKIDVQAASRTARCCCSSRSLPRTKASTRRRRRVPSAPAWARRSSPRSSAAIASPSGTSATRGATGCAARSSSS